MFGALSETSYYDTKCAEQTASQCFPWSLTLTSGGKRGNCRSECESIAWVSTKLLCGTLRMGYLTEQLKIKKENQNFWLKTLFPLYFYQLSWTNDDTWAFTYLTSGVAMLATVSGRALGTTMLLGWLMTHNITLISSKLCSLWCQIPQRCTLLRQFVICQWYTVKASQKQCSWV